MPDSCWQEQAAKWLERKAELEMNSLCCADNSMTIYTVQRYAATLRHLAKEIRSASDA